MSPRPQSGRHTTVLAIDAVPSACRQAMAEAALRRGFDWRLDRARLLWATDSVAAGRGLLRRRSPVVHTLGCLDDRHLAWCVAEDDDDKHAALIVRFDQVSVRDGSVVALGVSPSALASTGRDADGVEIRGDVGGGSIGTVFLGIGADSSALRVREAVLAAAGHTDAV